MDWNLAIERNTEALKRIVAMLVAMAGLGAAITSAGRPTLPRRLHRAILRLLRPAESAVRRLIVIAARGLKLPPSPPRVHKPKSAPPSIFLRNRIGTGIVLPPGMPPPGRPPRPVLSSIPLPLLDPLQNPFRRRRPAQSSVPRISYPGVFSKLSPVKLRRPPTPDDRLDATRLTLRLQALVSALDDLPAHAKRFARWQANRARDKARDAEAAFLTPAEGGGEVARAKPETVRGLSRTAPKQASHRFRRYRPLRPGRPPGSIRRPDHEVREILTDLHALAFDVLEHPDTS